MTPRLRFPRGLFDLAVLGNNGVARRLVLALILFSSAITAVLTASELYFEYRDDIRGIDRRIESIRDVYLPALAESVWVAEGSRIQTQLDGLRNLRDIEYLAIVVDGTTRWHAGARKSSRHIEKVIPLLHPHRGKELEIGDLHVVASVDDVLARIWSKLLLTLARNGVKTLLVTAFMLLIFQVMVGQHLEHLSAHLRREGRKVAGAKDLRLNRPETGLWRPDALDHVANAVNAMHRELARSHAELVEANQRLETIIESSPLAIYTRDTEGLVTSWNPAAERMFGWQEAEVLGEPLPTVPPEGRVESDNLRKSVLGGEVVVLAEVRRRKRDGSPIEISTTLAPLRDASGRAYGYLAIASDISDRKAAERQVEFLAYHDALTKLPNRALAEDRMRQIIAYADRTGTKVALLVLDLDNFKSINDSLGHAAGDAVIKEIAERLAQSVNEADTVSRRGGDEFLIVLQGVPDAEAIAPVLARIMERLHEPIRADGHDLSTAVSIGIAIYPDDGGDFETLLKKADMAMYRAKDAGRNTYRFFDEEMNVEAVEHLTMRNGLRRALERREFVLHYQPQVDLASGAVVGVEALIRWHHPEHGPMLPDRFIPFAEHEGMIVPIGEWVIGEVCRQAMAWRRAGLPELRVAVNLSAAQFMRGDVEQTLVAALQESGLDPSLLELELTESLLVQHVDNVLATVKRLKVLGVQLSIDDFGTGYSSLSYLKRFYVDKLKIDQSFVRDLATDPNDAAIVRAIIQMAHSLNLRTVAEGVEDARILEHLRIFHCDEAQGYHFAAPMPAEDFARYLAGARATQYVAPSAP